NVWTVMDASLQACGVVFPLAMLTSICRSIVTICSGLYLCMGMTRFSSKWILSHSTWYKLGRSGQSALSRQITEIEEQLRFQLFTRDNRRVVRVDLTDAGRVFVEEARSSLLHMERAIHLARVAHDGGDNDLIIGHSL